jgi:ribosomal-protein-alanine N-acetyltransferase
MEERDVDGVARLERDTFSAPWKPDTFRRLLTRDTTELWVVETPADGVVGYAVLWFVLEHGELANIAVRPEHRGRGLGSFLLDRIVERARERGVRSLYLEVRVSNGRAAELYERRGFREVGRRRDYYQRPREDARVLAKELT